MAVVAAAAEGPGDGEFVISLARGLTVIRSFSEERPQQTLSELAAVTGLSRAVVRRFVHTLVALGYARRVGPDGTAGADGKLFALTPRVLELGFSYLSSQPLPEIVQPHLERLSREVGESVSTAILAGPDVVYVARVPTRRIMRVGITIGTRFPAFVTSMGRVLLADLSADERARVLAQSELEAFTERTIVDPAVLNAELDRVHAQGWALVDGELEVGLRSIAVPVHRRDGSVAAAVNLSTSATQVTHDQVIDELLPRLRETAAAIDADLALV